MPGIFGIISKRPQPKYEGHLKIMLESMTHEPFYKKGSYVNETLGVYAGWTCHPSSYADCTPAFNETRDLHLLFAGEQFDGNSPSNQNTAADLLRRYEQKGEEFLRDLNGWFSGLLIDSRRSKVILFNDRYGMHRIYYHEAKDAFLFGSEAKPLLQLRPELRLIDNTSLGELISCNCVLNGRTLFKEIYLLPGSAVWRWQNGSGPTRSKYFDVIEWERQPSLNEDEFFEALKATALTVMPRYFSEKGKVGLSLTGGLDSRMIMACLNPKPGELPCYTFGGSRDVRDVIIARQVAELYGQSYSVIRLGERFFSQFATLAEKTIRVSDGNLDICNSHDMYFNELAREIAPIRVTGKFGSEVIRDHSMFNAAEYRGDLFVGDLLPYVKKGVSTLLESKQGHPLSVAVFKDFPWREYNKIALEQSQMTFRSPYMDNNLVQLIYQAPPRMRSSNWPQRRLIKECNAMLSAILSDRGFGDNPDSVAGRLVELYYYAMFKIDYTYIFALPHWLTKLDTFLMSINRERQFLGTQKFEYYRIWFRRELAPYIKEVLLDPRTASRGYFNSKHLEKIVNGHTSGTHNYLNEINRAMSLELTHRILFEC